MLRLTLRVRHDGETLSSYNLELRLPQRADAFLLLGEEVIAECTTAGGWEHIGDTNLDGDDVDELTPSSLLDLVGE